MTRVDDWLELKGPAELDNPEFVDDLRHRFWMDEARDFAKDRLRLVHPSDDLLARLCVDLQKRGGR